MVYQGFCSSPPRCTSCEFPAPESGASLLQQSPEKTATSSSALQSEMAMKTAIGLDHSRHSFQEGRGLSSQELKLLIVQREVAYERLAAKLERARDDLEQLRMQQSHQLHGSAVLDEAQPDEKPKGTDKSEEDSISKEKKNADESEEASDSDDKSDD